MGKIYKVIKIIDEYQVVINAGKNKSLTKGQILEIFVPGEKIYDPDTKEFLGTLDLVKAYLCVKDVFDKMCICENDEKTPITIPTLDLFNTKKRLNVDSKDISGGLSGSTKIQLGDLVRES